MQIAKSSQLIIFIIAILFICVFAWFGRTEIDRKAGAVRCGNIHEQYKNDRQMLGQKLRQANCYYFD